jgi:hypothetical protein
VGFSKLILIASIAVFALLSSGCATIGRDGRNQAVLIQSEPPGAEIVLDGKSVGQTPKYVFVPREKHPQLTLRRDGVSKNVEMETKYRWGASFFSNFTFYVAAPVGWLIDFASGSAWNPQDPEVVHFENPQGTSSKTADDASPTLPPIASVAVAPPNAESLELSNAAIPVLNESVGERQGVMGYKLLPYDQTLPQFLHRGYDFDSSGSEDEKRFLYQSLGVDGVWHSSFVRDGDEMKLEAKLEDVRTRKITDQIDILLDRTDERSRAYAQGFHLITLPNAVTFSLSTQYFTYDRPNGGSVSLQAADTRNWWQKGLQYLSAISITNLPTYRPDRMGRWSINFIPIIRVSRRDLVANGTPEIDGQEFTRWLAAVGYGPEIGYQTGRHFFYFDLDLNATWTDISWMENGRDVSVSRSGLQTSLEFGYLYAINDTWSLRLFAASFPENSEAWREALRKTSNGTIGAQAEGAANNSTVGISLGFNFEPFLVRTFREKIRKAPPVLPTTPYQAHR